MEHNLTRNGEVKTTRPDAATFNEVWNNAGSESRMLGKLSLKASGRGGSVRQEYAEFLQGYRWDYFLTSTFKSPRKEPYYALQSVTGELRKHNVARAFLVAEPHQSGDLHIHGIVAGSIRNGNNLMHSPSEIWDGLFHRFGRAKVEPCHSHEAVSSYCSKYLLKQQDRVCDYYEVVGNKLAWQRGKLDVSV